MASRSRTYGACAFSAFLAAALTVGAAASSLDQRKDAAVKTALDSQGRTHDHGRFREAVHSAQALTAIRFDSSSAVVLEVTGQPEWRRFSIENGRKVVIDLYDTVNLVPRLTIDGEAGSPVQRIRTSLFQLEPRFISRIVLDLNQAVPVEVTSANGAIRATVTGANSSPRPQASSTDHTVYTQRHAALNAALEAGRDRLLALSPTPRHHVAFGYARVMERAQTQWAGLETAWNVQKLEGTTVDYAAAWAVYETSIKALEANVYQHCLAAIAPQTEFSPVLAALDAELARVREGHPTPMPAADVEALIARAESTGNGAAILVRAAGQTFAGLAAELTGAVAMAWAHGAQAIAEDAEIYLAQRAADDAIIRLTNADVDAHIAEHGVLFVTHGTRAVRPRTTGMTQVDTDTEHYILTPSSTRWAATVNSDDAWYAQPAEPMRLAQVSNEAVVIDASPALQSTSDTAAVSRINTVRSASDPLDQLVDIDFRDMELSNAVAILARKAQVNVVAGPPLTGTITASLKNVPLRRAMEILLQLNDLGIIEEEGILRIVPYPDAAASNRITQTVYLENAKATELGTTLQAVVSGAPDSEFVSIAPNDSTNILVIAGPPLRVRELAALAQELDIAEPVLPTITQAIPLNYAEPADLKPVVESLLTEQVGSVEVDARSRHLIVKDVPAVIEQIRALVDSVDQPVKSVAIHAMLVDVVLRDASQLGTNWLFELFPGMNRRGEVVGDFQGGSAAANLGNIGTTDLDAGILSFGLLNRNYGLQARIAAEVGSSNAEILANPVIITTENKEANITIAQEFPYQEFTQGLEGPPVATTNFKDIGITLTVLPRVTHDNHVIVDVDAKQSSVSGLTDTGVPIEDKRTAQTTLTVADGQTIFIGGLRNVSDRLNTSKIPVLGDIPVLNFMFKNTSAEKIHTELMIFLTTHVIVNDLPELTPAEQTAHDKIGDVPYIPDSQRAMFRHIVKPGEMRDPAWKWRRSK